MDCQGNMDCQRYIELMTDYMEGELSQTECALWEKHFSDCSGCGAFFHSFKTSVELIQHVRTVGCPKGVKQRLEKFLAERTNLHVHLSE